MRLVTVLLICAAAMSAACFEIELRNGETLAQQPEQTHINNSDLDASRDFVIVTRSSSDH